MNKFDTMKDNWRNNTDNAIKTIDDFLNFNLDYYEAKDFKKLANWLVNTPIKHYDFLSNQDIYSIDNAISFASLLQNLHHAMVDNGDMCFVSVEKYKTFILFAHPLDNYFPTLLDNNLVDLNKNLKGLYDIMSTVFEKNQNEVLKEQLRAKLATMPRSIKDLNITTHNNVDRFIKEVEELDRVSLEKSAKFKELRINIPRIK